MSTSNTITLFTYFRSSCSWRVRIALAIKNLEHECRYVNLIKDGVGEQRGPEYSAVNPMQQVPSIEVDGAVITQSAAILEYLEEVHPSPPLLPTDPLERASCRALCQLITAGIQPLQNLTVLKKVGEGEERARWAKFWISRGFDALEQLLAATSRGGPYCCGDRLTLADVCLVPQVANAERFEVDMARYPTIAKINNTLQQLEPFRRAHAFRQPDCPDHLRIKD